MFNSNEHIKNENEFNMDVVKNIDVYFASDSRAEVLNR